MSKIAAIIPAYNEAISIRDVAERTLRQVPWLIVVDDGSTDGTGAALDGLPVTVLRNDGNCGKAASLARAMGHALGEGAEAVITLDGDGQHRPEDIPRLLAVYHGNRDAIVIGSRLHDRRNIPIARYLANRFASFWIAWAAGQPIADSQSGFRVYPGALLRGLSLRCDRAASFVFESEILIEAGRRGADVIGIPVTVVYDGRRGRSHFRPILDIVRITRMVAWKLLSRGLDLPGLVRSLRSPDPRSRDGLTDHGSGAPR